MTGVLQMSHEAWLCVKTLRIDRCMCTVECNNNTKCFISVHGVLLSLSSVFLLVHFCI